MELILEYMGSDFPMEDMRLALKYVIVGIPHEYPRKCEQTLRNIDTDIFLRLFHHVPLTAQWTPRRYRIKRSKKVELMKGDRSGALWNWCRNSAS
jgi:hypothetical protein